MRLCALTLCLGGIGVSLVAAAPEGAAPAPAAIGHDAPLQNGDAAVTNFSGVIDNGGGTEADPAAGLAIDPDGNSALVLRLGQPAVSGLTTLHPPIVRAYKASEIGQVFAIARSGTMAAPIFFGATSAFGLNIFKLDPATGAVTRLKHGDPQAQWMDGQWGPGGGPGSIWRADAATGEVKLFATLPNNSGPGIGGLLYIAASGHLYASDLDNGLIYNIDANGTVAGTFDHGVDGLAAAGEPPLRDDPSHVANITDPSFNSEDPASWGFTAPERQVTALALSKGRLYYAVAAGPSIWSVSLNPDGSFGKDTRAAGRHVRSADLPGRYDDHAE